nr:hypothetical protein [Tanacetum cinerariifolium]
MVAFLKKPQGTEDFHQIVDFLNASHIREKELNATVDGQDKTITEASVRRHLKLADDNDEAITKEMYDRLGRATTNASSLEAEQGSGKISKTQTKVTPSGPSSPRTSSEGGPGCHVTMGVVMFRLGLKGYLTCPVNHHSEKARLQHWRMNSKAVYNKALITLTKRVKKLEKKLKHKRRRAVIDSSKDEDASLDKKDSPKQERMIEEIDEDENTNLVKSSKQGEAHETAGCRKESDDTEVVDFSTASPQKDDDEETLAETLVSIKKSAAKDKGEGSSKEGKTLKRPAEEELGQEQQKKQQKAGGILKRETLKAKEDKDKRQKKQDDPENLTLIDCMEVIFYSKQVISVIPLAVKSSVVNWKSYCKGDVGYYEIHKADGNGDDAVWKNHHSQELIEWKLYDSYGVHSLMLGEVSIHMLVEKKYPLPHDTLTRMLQWKLHVNYNVTEMAYELLRFIRAQLNQ